MSPARNSPGRSRFVHVRSIETVSSVGTPSGWPPTTKEMNVSVPQRVPEPIMLGTICVW